MTRTRKAPWAFAPARRAGDGPQEDVVADGHDAPDMSDGRDRTDAIAADFAARENGARRKALDLDEESRANPAEEAGHFIDFIKRLELGEYQELIERWKQARAADRRAEPDWYRLHVGSDRMMRETVRNPEAPQGTLSMLALRLGVYYAGLTIIAASAAAGLVLGLIGLEIPEVVAALEEQHKKLEKYSPFRAVVQSLATFLFIEISLLAGGFLLVRRIARPTGDFIAKGLKNIASLGAGAAGLAFGFVLTITVGDLFGLAGKQKSLTSLEAFDGPLTMTVLLSATLIAAFLTGAVGLVRWIHFWNERNEYFQIRTTVRNTLMQTQALRSRYLERAKQTDTDYAPEALLKQRLISRLHWDYLYSIPLMFLFLRLDIIDEGFEEIEKLFRRWCWVFVSGVAAGVGAHRLGALDLDKAAPLIQLWVGGGLAFLAAGFVALRWASGFSRNKLARARAVVKPRLDPEDYEIFPTNTPRERMEWEDRFDSQELLQFVHHYKYVLEELNDITHYGRKNHPLGDDEAKAAAAVDFGEPGDRAGLHGR